jgi:hypothetical protein
VGSGEGRLDGPVGAPLCPCCARASLGHSHALDDFDTLVAESRIPYAARRVRRLAGSRTRRLPGTAREQLRGSVGQVEQQPGIILADCNLADGYRAFDNSIKTAWYEFGEDGRKLISRGM